MSIITRVNTASNRGIIPTSFKEWAIDAFSACVMAAALAIALFDMLGFAGGFAQICGYVVCTMLAAVILSRKWWVTPLLLFIAVFAAAAMWAFDKGFDLKYEYIAGFITWVYQGMPLRAPYSFDYSVIAVNAISVFPLAALSYAFMRRLFSFTALVIAALALTLALFLTDSAALDMSLLLMLSAAVCTLPRVSGRSVYGGRKAADNSDRGESQSVTRFSMQALAIPAAILCVALAAASTPSEPAKWRSRIAASLVSDITDIYDFYFSDMRTEDGYSIGRSGYLPLGDRLGGDIAPSRDRVLSIITENPIPLRGSVSDTYNGQMWYDGWKNGRFRYGSFFWRAKRIDSFTESLPAGGIEGANLREKMTDVTTMRVSYVKPGISDMFTVSGATDFRLTMTPSAPLFFNLQSEMAFGNTMRIFDAYEFTVTYYNRQKQGFSENMLAFETLVSGEYDEYWDDIAYRNTYLPDDLPGEVYELAQNLTGVIASPYNKAVAIENWLRANCTYTFTPGEPAGGDFVASFIQNREGYCVYYASAMGVLARCAGIPSRYVTGYGLNMDDTYTPEGSESRYYATDMSAHAWTELYFKGIGWIAFDPLGYDTSALTEGDMPRQSQQIGASSALESEEMMEEETYAPFDISLLNINQNTRKPVGIWTIVGIVAASAAALYIAFRVINSRFITAYALNRVQKRFPAMRQRVDYYYGDIINQLRYWGLTVTPGDTVRTIMERAGRTTRLDGLRFDQIGAIVMRQRYGEIDAEPEELRSLYFSHDAIEDHLKEALGKRAYFLRRALGIFKPHSK